MTTFSYFLFSPRCLATTTMLVVATSCSPQATTQVPVALQTSLRINAVAEDGAPVANAPISVTVFNRRGLLIERREGNFTDESGSYLLVMMAPLEGMQPVTINVDPPAGSPLRAVQVNDSTVFMKVPATTRVVTVTLPP